MDLSQKRFAVLLSLIWQISGDVVWAKLGAKLGEAWPAVVTNPCTADAKVPLLITLT